MIWKGLYSWIPQQHPAYEKLKVEMHLFEDSNEYRITPPPPNCQTFAFMPYFEETILDFLPLITAIMQDLLQPYQTIAVMSAMERRFCLTHSKKIETAMDNITQWSLEHPQTEMKVFPVDGLALYAVTNGMPQLLTTHFMENSSTYDFYDIYGYPTKSDLQTAEEVNNRLSRTAFEIHITYERHPDILYIDINKSSLRLDKLQREVENVTCFHCKQFGILFKPGKDS